MKMFPCPVEGIDLEKELKFLGKGFQLIDRPASPPGSLAAASAESSLLELAPAESSALELTSVKSSALNLSPAESPATDLAPAESPALNMAPGEPSAPSIADHIQIDFTRPQLYGLKRAVVKRRSGNKFDVYYYKQGLSLQGIKSKLDAARYSKNALFLC